MEHVTHLPLMLEEFATLGAGFGLVSLGSRHLIHRIQGNWAARTGVRRKGVEIQNALQGRKGSQINAVRKDM